MYRQLGLDKGYKPYDAVAAGKRGRVCHRYRRMNQDPALCHEGDIFLPTVLFYYTCPLENATMRM